MRPKKLELQNIGPFVNTHSVDFSALGSIFLVCGKTGAGKTTLFDAIFYAFYGKPLGSRSDITKSLRSEYAGASDEAAVSFEFYLGENLYRIRRRIAYTPPNKKREIPEEVSLAQKAADGWKDISCTNKSETDAKIKALVKLTDKEFSRIVVLPQGEFSQFLKANSKEKKETLINLFPVETYTNLMERAKQQADEAKQNLRLVEKRLEALQAEFNHHTYESESKKLSDELDLLRNAQKENRKKIAEISSKITEEEALEEKLQKYAQAQNELEACKQQEQEILLTKQKIENARKAAPLVVRAKQLEELREETVQLNQEIETKTKLQQELEQFITELHNRREEIEEKKLLSIELKKTQGKLSDGIRIADELKAEKTEGQQLREGINKLQAEKLDMEKREAESLQTIETLQESIDAFTDRQENFNRLKDALELWRKLSELTKKKTTVQQYYAMQNGAAEKSLQELKTTEKDLEIALATQHDLIEEKKNAERREEAAHLAQHLIPGEPCPVCGSREHPQPAATALLDSFSFDDKIQAAERQVEKLQKDKEEQKDSYARCTASAQQYQTQLGELREELNLIASQNSDLNLSDFPDENVLKQKIAALSEEAEKAAALFKDSSKALQDKKKPEQALEQIRTALKETSQKIATAEARLSGIRSAYAAKNKQLQEILKTVPSIINTSDLENAHEECNALILKTDNAINGYTEDLQESEKKQSAIQSELQALRQNRIQKEKAKAEIEENLQAELEKAGFQSAQDLLSAGMSELDIQNLKNDIEVFTNKQIANEQLVNTLKAEIGERRGGNLPALTAQLEDLQKDGDTIQAQAENTASKLNTLKENQDKHKKLSEEFEEKRLQAAEMICLAEELNGSNKRKLQFDTWMLSSYLHEVTIYANKRLEKMSEGRYRLQVSEDSSGGKGYKGLDLAIADSYTGSLRPSASLSGGETFMASISLALGLADSIQAQSGGIRLDSMFIDEGFGSLDDASLDRAISILDEIREGDRMVGIISHVGELRTRIPQKIEIEKTNTGSRIVQN
ncbi:exonuclease subunit SbcC [Treponema phagedenis]|uniref:Nuclease SbcCD subunit C n=1 Tax=Treponema phagedenis TaxID=162 RepID=A0AAE6M7S3_TREPH|nr:exonuclease subunit SbcC [Treponema phagedenis]QEJ96617.1 exonuclease subunit SbcC [Treponema phagedenis]QEK02403.1 exonuclease subunit SbcC [Treponema phagedenis]QEK08034.1 exonuclease subunit SbcC [Treponema phagedenis]